jgi:hypothetical protein
MEFRLICVAPIGRVLFFIQDSFSFNDHQRLPGFNGVQTTLLSMYSEKRLRKQITCLLVFAGLAWSGLSLAQDSLLAKPSGGGNGGDSLDVSVPRMAVVGGVVAIGVGAIHLYQANAWWKTSRGPFHIEEDLHYALNVDKVGHLYGASVLTFMLSRGLRWSNFSEEKSLFWGAIGSTLFQTYIEVEDGFSLNWGFDRVDFAADLVGAWYPVAQYYAPLLRDINIRFSYLPKNPGASGGFPGQTHTIFDDYEGQTLWLSLNVGNLLPTRFSSWWPSFLVLSVGVAVRDQRTTNPYLVWFLSPDLDMSKIIPQDTEFLRSLARALNYIHFPLPAIRFAPGWICYGLYF